MSSAGESRLPIDPNVKIPSAVLKASAAADAAHKQAYTGDAPAAPAPTAAAPAPTPSPTAAAPAAPAPTAAAPSQLPDTGTGDTWENRFKASQGRLEKANQTISQQQGTISSLEGRLANVENLMANMQAQPQAPAPRELDAKSLVTPEEIQAYGPEFMDVVARVARQQFGSQLEARDNEIASLKQQLNGVTHHVAGDARERMFQKMDAALPEWRTQNTDARFLAWLRLTDTYSGAIRGELLKQAFAQNNADRVLAFFKGFLAEEATVAPATLTAPANDGRPSLEDLAAPGRAKSEAVTQQGNPSEKPLISRAQITQFYADVRAGKYRGREQEKAKAEEEIFAAERDGRIR